MASEPLTHRVHYAGDRFQVAAKQATRIVNALIDARNGVNTFMGIPASDTGNGHTVVRYLLIGPGIPALVEGHKTTGPPASPPASPGCNLKSRTRQANRRLWTP
jgi:hypothetical protein